MDEFKMNYLSVCSGIEAATVAWHHMGWKAVGYSEIEKFPSQVLAHHYPQVPNFGNMTKYKEWNINDSIGLLVGGTPCQSFSVAGLRKGLDDPRGNLALTYCGILDHFRPKWFVWENVPGVLSSGNGRDFGAFLGAVAQLGYGFSYRVLDAQYFGVAQRRRRVFVVGHFGDWQPATKVLFESDCLQRNIGKGKEKKQNNSNCSSDGLVGTLLARDYKGIGSYDYDKIITQPIPIHAQATQFKGGGDNRKNDGKGNGLGIGKPGDPMNTLDTSSRHAVFNKMSVRRLTEVECERLQGFPVNYTNIRENCPSGARYKALGNSMAVPVMRWIGERINNYERI